ncbi:MAG TPA: hypothetical protein VGM10_18710 [Actinocrinis sp.]|jgi:hypothetical protein
MEPTADEAILGAEELVRGAWRRELLRQRNQMQGAVKAAGDDCDGAYRMLVAAVRAGDPAQVTAACATLQETVEVTRRSVVACDRVSRALQAELDLLACTARPVVAGPARNRPANQTSGPGPATKPVERGDGHRAPPS